jgi:hypothetical protein
MNGLGTSGPLGPFNDDGVVDLLRAAGQGGADPSPADVTRAMAAGRKIRRRRQTMQIVGSGLAIAAVLGVGVTTMSALDDGGRETVATSPDTTTPVPGNTTTSLPDANLQLLAEALGPDFQAVPSSNLVRLDPDSATGRQLPADYQVTALISIVHAQLGKACDARSENQHRFSACRPTTGEDGRVVLIQDYRTDLQTPAPTKNADGKWTAVDGTYAFFDRGDSTYVWVTLLAVDKSPVSNATRQTQAVQWLGGFTDKLAEVAGNPRVQPKPGKGSPQDAPGRTAEVPTDPGQRAMYLGDALVEDLGEGWANASGEVLLDPGSKLAGRLPGGYTAHVVTQLIDQAAFNAACNKRPGLVPCDQEQNHDATIYRRSFADRNDTTGALYGESAVYRPVGGGEYLLIVITVDGTNVPATRRDADVATVNQWFASVHTGLLGAATDPRVESALDAIGVEPDFRTE